MAVENMTTSGATFVYSRPPFPIGRFSRPSITKGSSFHAIRLKVAISDSGTPRISPPIVVRDVRYTDVPEILRMSKAEYVAAIEALSGIWSDRNDMPDDWIDEIRGEWDNRIDDLYDSSSEAANPSV